MDASASRRPTRRVLAAVLLAGVIAAGLVGVIGRYRDDHGIVHLGIVLLVLESLALYLPFGLLGGASADVGGERAPFRRWYLALVLAFVVNQVFTSPVNLDRLGSDDNLSRVAILSLLNGLVVAVMALLAAVFGNVRFCPTGGITQDSAPAWLAEPAVACVGGSWLVPRGQPIDPAEITARAKAAAALRSD